MNNRVTAEAFKIKKVKGYDLFYLKAFLYQILNSDFGFAEDYNTEFIALGKEIEALEFNDLKTIFKNGFIDIEQTDFYYFEDQMHAFLDYLQSPNKSKANVYSKFPSLFTDIRQVSFDQGGLIIFECFGMQIYELYTASGKYKEGPCHDLDLLDKNRYLYRSSGFSPGFVLEEYHLNTYSKTLNTYGDFDMPRCPNIGGRDRLAIPYYNEQIQRIENFTTPKNRLDVSKILEDINTNWFTSPELHKFYWNDKELALKAVQKDMLAYTLLDRQLKDDQEIVVALVKANGIALEFTSEAFKADKSIVLTAVLQDGYALEFASTELKADKEIVTAAVKQEEYALQFASEELKRDSDIINLAKRDYDF
jgi:hypothetical protein